MADYEVTYHQDADSDDVVIRSFDEYRNEAMAFAIKMAKLGYYDVVLYDNVKMTMTQVNVQ